MPTINDHKTNECNEAIAITCDERNPANGNASHQYQMLVTPPDGKPSFVVHIGFQDGPIKEVGVNGITNEALLAVLIDRMRGFQSGPYASRDNAVALTKMEEALMWLHKRTRDRLARGVEGTHAK